MKVSELFAEITLKPDFNGFITADDMVLAADITGKASSVDDYEVIQMGVKSVDASLNAEKKTNAYIRAGKSTTKTGTQRTFGIDADRYIGDAFQDYALSHEIKYGVGQSCIVPYAYFDRITGKGEKGKASIIVDTDGSGGAEENSGVSISLEKAGEAPAEFTYTKSGG